MVTEYQGYSLLTVVDFFMVPLSILLCYSFIISLSKKIFCKNPTLITIVKRAFIVKLLFTLLFFIIIFTMYADRNDQMGFFYHLQVVIDVIKKDPIHIYKIFLRYSNESNFLPVADSYTNSFLSQSSMYSILKLELLLLPISFNSFIALNIYGTFIGFIGLLLIYATLVKLYPDFYKQISWSVFYVPTMCFYSCGVVKEGLTLLSMGILLHFSYHLIIKKRITKQQILLLVIFSPLGFFAKPYVFLLFIPAILLSLYYPTFRKINWSVRSYFILSFLLLVVLFVWSVGYLEERLSFANIAETINLVQIYTSYASDIAGGKGNYEPINIDIQSISGLSSLVLDSLALSFFRPYFWESESFLFLFVSIENLFVIILILRCFFWGSKRRVQSNQIFIIFIFFVIPFSVFVATSTANFGALLRYKIPMIPFLYSFLFIYGTKKTSSSYC